MVHKTRGAESRKEGYIFSLRFELKGLISDLCWGWIGLVQKQKNREIPSEEAEEHQACKEDRGPGHTDAKF